jgi:hypothetical protein
MLQPLRKSSGERNFQIKSKVTKTIMLLKFVGNEIQYLATSQEGLSFMKLAINMTFIFNIICN